MSDELDLNGLEAIFEDEEGGEPRRKNRLTIDYKNDNVDYNDPIAIIKNNIKRANAILDAIQLEMINGNFTARMVEVAGNLINSITASGKEIIADINYQGYLQIKEEMVKLKEREIELRATKGQKTPLNQNIILTSRDDLLKLLNKNATTEIKVIENKNEKEN